MYIHASSSSSLLLFPQTIAEHSEFLEEQLEAYRGEKVNSVQCTGKAPPVVLQVYVLCPYTCILVL